MGGCDGGEASAKHIIYTHQPMAHSVEADAASSRMRSRTGVVREGMLHLCDSEHVVAVLAVGHAFDRTRETVCEGGLRDRLSSPGRSEAGSLAKVLQLVIE
jgi:hypothetical protein